MLSNYLGFRGSKNKSSSKKHSPTVIEEQCHQFLLEDLRKSTNNFDKKLVIREGLLATRYKGCLKQHNGATDCAIELRRMRGTEYYYEHEFKSEITMLCQLRHPNIVSLMGFCNCKEKMIIVYEYMPNGSLHDHLYSRDMEPLSWKKRLEICIGIARGLHYLHAGVKRSVVHCSVMPKNIRLDKNMVPKISGFGFSIQGALSTSKPKPIVEPFRLIEASLTGAYQYIAPENSASGVITDKIDVYAFGEVLLEMVCITDNETIFNKAKTLVNQQWGESGKEYLREFSCLFILKEIETFLKRLPIEEIIDPILEKKIAPECWQVFVDVTQGCLKYEPDERPTMGEVEVLLEHALSLQEDADIRKTDGDYYTLLSTTYINPQPVICIDVQELFCHQFSLDDLRQTTYNFTEEKGLVKLNGPTCPIPILVKKIDWPSICGDGKQWDFKKEIEKIWQLRHPNLASLLGVCDHYDEKILVYMYFDRKARDSYVVLMDLTWKKRLVTCIEVSQGLDYLHKATIFHRNLKLSNMLIDDDDMVPKLINFGLPWTNPLDAGACVAPELFQGHDFTCKCDVYSFGLALLQMIFEMWLPRLPICKKNIPLILKGKIAPQCCEVFLDITQRCLKREANERPTMSEVKTQLQHALALQEEADANTTGDYRLPKTFDARIKAFAGIRI